MNEKKTPSPKTYKICSNICFILFVFCLLIGLPTFVVGGFILVIGGLFFFYLWKLYRKQAKTLSQKETPKTVNTSLPQEAPKPVNAPLEQVQNINTESVSEPIKPIKKETTLPGNKVKTYKVAGVSYREKDIIALGLENEDYSLTKKEIIENGLEDDRIYEYEFYPDKIELVPEPENPHDPNAIKVIVDGVHVGYIKSGSCSHVHKLLKENRIEKIDCTIGGGKYKYLDYDIDEDKYTLEKSDSPIFVHLEITEN